jgi:Flp pilus assembly pilin Flp
MLLSYTDPLIRDRRGVTALEYALIGGIITAAVAVSAASIGPAIQGFFATLAQAFP